MRDNRVIRRLVNLEATILVSMALSQDDVADRCRRYLGKQRAASASIAERAGIPKGVRLNSISNLDVAPTIAGLLGLEMKQAQGHAIPEIAKPGTGR